MPEADQIIEAFDQCLEYTFGSAFARDNRHKSDVETSQKWITVGADVVLATIVFSKQMDWMHEKFLRSGHLRDRKFIPHSLKVFDENIEMAIRRMNGIGIVDAWEVELSLWRARFKSWQKTGIWQTEMYGSAPFEPGCRVPKSILEEFKRAA